MKALFVVCVLAMAHGLGQKADLPPHESFFTETREALSRSQQLWHRYSYRERRKVIPESVRTHGHERHARHGSPAVA